MCGRINVSDHPGVQTLLDFLDIPLYGQPSYKQLFEARYNIAPGANLYSVYANNKINNADFMRWGILPAWAKPDKFSRPLINARSETVWEKPSFKNLIKNQRVIIPINGFYEWQRDKNTKTAFHIHATDKPALALGGLYQISKEGNLQCCVVTTAANETMSPIHDRMPVILSEDSMSDWLHSDDKFLLDELMLPTPASWITVTRVSSYVNNAGHDGKECIKPFMSDDLFGA
ncbi:MAG: SOS response-associated peptidase [Gammaproteobacteria bacterium]|nr:SOS response-associated peptidase [Gammaproteobacteria bacterium]